MASPLRRILRSVLKITGLTLGLLFIGLLVALWIVFKKKDAWLVERIQAYLNTAQSGQLVIESAEIRVLRSFPNVTLELKGVSYYEHPDSLRSKDERPILRAERIYAAAEFIPLLNDELNIGEITLSGCSLHLIEYDDHSLNLQRAIASPAKPRPAGPVYKKKAPAAPVPRPAPPPSLPPPQFDLRHFEIDNAVIDWVEAGSDDTAHVSVQHLRCSLRRHDHLVDGKIESSAMLHNMTWHALAMPPGDVALSAAVHYDDQEKKIVLDKSDLHCPGFTVSLQGSYAHKAGRKLDVSIDATAADLGFLSGLVHAAVLKQNAGLVKRGDIYLKGRLYGALSRQSLRYDLTFGIRKLNLRIPNGPAFRNVGFEGSLTSGDSGQTGKERLSIRNLRGELPGGFVRGGFSVRNFSAPYLSYDVAAKLNLSRLDEIFILPAIQKTGGTVSVQGRFDGPLQDFATHKMDNRRSSSLVFENVSFLVNKTNLWVAYLSGQVENQYNQATIRQLGFRYGKNDMLIDASVKNLVYWLLKGEKEMVAEGRIRCGTLYTRDFITDTLKTADIQDCAHDVDLDFEAKTSAVPGQSAPIIDFNIRNLSSRFEKLPDIVKLKTWGRYEETSEGIRLDLSSFHATLPHGSVDLSGGFVMPESRKMQLHAQVALGRFPWTYLQELIAEMSDGKEATHKKLPLDSMIVVDAYLDLKADIITYPFDIESISVKRSRANVVFRNKSFVRAEDMDIAMQPFHFIHPPNSGELTGIHSANGTISMKRFHMSRFNEFDLAMKVKGTDNKLELDFHRTTQWSKQEHGLFVVDHSGDVPSYRLQTTTKHADLDFFLSRYYKKNFMTGNIDFRLDLQAKGPGWDNVRKSASGIIDISGDSLVLHGMDIENALEKFERSQHFNLTDVGAVVVAGPVGLAVTKGTDFVSLASVSFDSLQRTDIVHLASKWKLDKQSISSRDVAFSTARSRIAFNGIIDFGHDSIPGMTIAVVDRNGCSMMDQTLYGSMHSLQSGKVNIAKTLFGSVINFFDDVSMSDCKPVYQGRITHPPKK